jgi:opacity protein-like surface antigen
MYKDISLKKIATGLLLVSTSSFAATMSSVRAPNYNNFYVGADIGFSHLNDNIFFIPTTNLLIKKAPVSGNGLMGGGLVGYDYTLCDKYKLGMEGFINLSNSNAHVEHYYDGSTYKIKSFYNAGVRVLPGYEFTPGTVGHIILGYANSKVNINDSGVFGVINQSANINGFQSGLGIKTSLSKNISIRWDGLYTNYDSMHGVGLPNVEQPDTSYNNSYKTLEADLTLVYKFDA